MELQSCLAAGRLDSECLENKARNRIEILINRYAIKEGTKSVVWGAGRGWGKQADRKSSHRRKPPGVVAKVWLIASKSEPVALKKAPRVSWAGGRVVTPKLLPVAAGVVVQPVKSPVSKSPLTMRLAEVDRAVATSRRPMERKNVTMHLSGVSGFMVLTFFLVPR